MGGCYTVTGQAVPDVLKNHFPPIFWVKQSYGVDTYKLFICPSLLEYFHWLEPVEIFCPNQRYPIPVFTLKNWPHLLTPEQLEWSPPWPVQLDYTEYISVPPLTCSPPKLYLATLRDLHGYCSHDRAMLGSGPRKLCSHSSFPTQDILPPTAQVPNRNTSQPWLRPKHISIRTVPVIVIRLPNHNPNDKFSTLVWLMWPRNVNLCKVQVSAFSILFGWLPEEPLALDCMTCVNIFLLQ